MSHENCLLSGVLRTAIGRSVSIEVFRYVHLLFNVKVAWSGLCPLADDCSLTLHHVSVLWFFPSVGEFEHAGV